MAMVKLAPLVVIAACANGLDAPASEVALDREYFRCNVQPVLAVRCSYPACHGSALRPLSLFAPGRMRFQVGWERPKAPLTDAELDANFAAASGFVATTLGDPLLVAKPLDTSAGGFYHRGGDLYREGDVFMSTDDAGYQILANWIAGETADATCQPTAEVGP